MIRTDEQNGMTRCRGFMAILAVALTLILGVTWCLSPNAQAQQAIDSGAVGNVEGTRVEGTEVYGLVLGAPLPAWPNCDAKGVKPCVVRETVLPEFSGLGGVTVKAVRVNLGFAEVAHEPGVVLLQDDQVVLWALEVKDVVSALAELETILGTPVAGEGDVVDSPLMFWRAWGRPDGARVVMLADEEEQRIIGVQPQAQELLQACREKNECWSQWLEEPRE